MKKILSIITAFSIILCMTGTAFAAVTEDDPGDMPDIPAVSVSETDAGVTVSDMSVEEALGIVERAAEKVDACEEVAGEVCGTELTEEEIEAIRIAIDLDKSTSDSGLRRDEAYFYSSADTQHGYYYDQLKDYQKEMYDAIGEACDSYLYSNRDGTDTSGFIDIISLDRSMPEVEVQQCYWTFFYSNPQYFFLPSGYSYRSAGSSSII
ncbi:MAG: hypothetical protein J6X85_09470, partial [Ruminococcus sp.]|nr:hypothetical protein [Ruminococcus sp.]